MKATISAAVSSSSSIGHPCNNLQQIHHPVQRTPLDTGQIIATTSTAMLTHPSVPQAILSPVTFLEPPQYLAAISVQPVMAPVMAPAAFAQGNAGGGISPVPVSVGFK